MPSGSRLVLRADGNAQIGLGHVVRLLALADMVRAEFAVCWFAIQQPTSAIRDMITSAGMHLWELPAQEYEAEAPVLMGQLQPTDVVVLDGYRFATAYQATVRQSGCRVAVVDDLRAWAMAADLVINHAPGVTPHDYQALSTTRFCLGPAFSLLRSEFRQRARWPQVVPHVTAVALCFGGADPQQLTVRCLTALLQLPQLRRISVVIGSAFAHEAALQPLIADHPTVQISVRRNLGSAEMAALFQAHDVVVCPASTVLLEALVLGCAAVTGYYVDNQRYLAAYVHEHRQAYSVGDFAQLPPEQLKEAMASGLRFHETILREPYAPVLATEELRREFQRLASR
ncbi:UDP-2,4-diacetamido-2,4,6-trideoxy-beta-L-altropyranose hydrolase [Hymenobacter busanensis]|uniref:UDP-2,4-diacetamido-2,4, 6-trideoxy-beta-L-altropyranose hydrolase n=1 Tax=Hymenobacter busanensis TaxID=2607656 RepID=A0A7L4ZZ74_9BACT|nr:UDP-2,4-diacetamido-2,4,6-trideoxy-beta-L-altropyranose hydrolase [Hymenobacter busanensis]KAA9339462.1 UDP-2,4-diacetamido-2,4,6-trideoxy-beta-L-altropyranose hydrolase [Hymenobacter busanensis]QHJ06780.1 UDP-2,4-diacetamido-2,4,6-trideoxy-beta-L-altropyranose hydrolase [Hymenobacter busanensis]